MDLFQFQMLTDGLEWCGLLWCFYQLSFWRYPFTAEHPLLRHWCRDKLLQMLTDGLEWCGLLWCFYQLSFWRHPFTAEHPLLRHWCRDKLLQMLTDGLEWCGLLWCFYQLSFWRHPFTAEHPLLRHWCSDAFLQTWWRHKLILISDDLRMRIFSADFHLWVNYILKRWNKTNNILSWWFIFYRLVHIFYFYFWNFSVGIYIA